VFLRYTDQPPHGGWDPELDIFQECCLDQEIPEYRNRAVHPKVWVDGTGLPRGDYSGWIKVWATGATNNPQMVSVVMHRY
jgi:hypothetical protein